MQRKLFRPLAAVALLALAAGAGTAQARDNVFWSLGVDAAPGVSLGVSNTRPVVVAPQPVYVAPQPVYVAPRPVVVHRPVVLVQPEPVYIERGRHRGHKHKHKHRGHRHGHDD
jgi:hypothetical protein